jgi:phosphotransferase system IIB component
MQIRELSNKMSSDVLNESLAKKFGYKLSLNKFTESQLQQAHSQLSEKVSTFEKTNSFDSVLENNEYQKHRAMLDVIRQALKERTLSPEEKAKKEKFVKGMKQADSTFKKKYGKDAENVKHATATKMAKKKSMDEAMEVLRGVLTERTLLEGEEEKAALIMSARDMVDRITGWLEDVSSMKAESMLELVDSIRDEMGSDVSQQFNDTVKPALEDLYKSLETHRTTMAQAVSILTGEEGPGGAAPAPTMAGAEMPATMGEPGEEPMGDEFAASEPATGGDEAAGRMKRESIQYSRRLGNILSSKKK